MNSEWVINQLITALAKVTRKCVGVIDKTSFGLGGQASKLFQQKNQTAWMVR